MKSVYGLLVLALMGCSDGRSTAEVRAPSPSDLPTVSPTVDLQLPEEIGQLGTPAGIGSDQHEVTVEDGRSAGARAVPEAPSTADPILPPLALADLLSESPWPESEWPTVEAIAFCESRLQADAVGDGGLALGLMQIRTDVHPRKAARYDLLDPSDNLSAAYEVWEQAGRSYWPWSCKP